MRSSKGSNQLSNALEKLAISTGDTALFPTQRGRDSADKFAENLRDTDTAKLRPIDAVNVEKRRRKP